MAVKKATTDKWFFSVPSLAVLIILVAVYLSVNPGWLKKIVQYDRLRSITKVTSPYSVYLPLSVDKFVGPSYVYPVLDLGKTVSSEIGSEGGSLMVVTAEGFEIQLVIPAGALQTTTLISMTPIIKILETPISIGFVAGVELEPQRLAFQIPASLYITMSDESLLISIAGFQYRDGGKSFILFPVQVTGNQIQQVTVEGDTIKIDIPHTGGVGSVGFGECKVVDDFNDIPLKCSDGTELQGGKWYEYYDCWGDKEVIQTYWENDVVYQSIYQYRDVYNVDTDEWVGEIEWNACLQYTVKNEVVDECYPPVFYPKDYEIPDELQGFNPPSCPETQTPTPTATGTPIPTKTPTPTITPSRTLCPGEEQGTPCPP